MQRDRRARDRTGALKDRPARRSHRHISRRVDPVDRQDAILQVTFGAVRVKGDRFEAVLIGRGLMTGEAAIAADFRDLLQMHLVREINAGIGLVTRADGCEFVLIHKLLGLPW